MRIRVQSGNKETRPAFTLLEVVLAAVIGVLLMGALYAFLQTQLRHTKAGRELIERSTLARALYNRMEADINTSLAPQLPQNPNASSGQGSGSMAGGSGGSGGSATSNGTTSNSSSSTPSSTSATSTSSASSAGTATLNIGVQGDASHVVLSVSQQPRMASILSDPANPQVISDLRRITYWLVEGGGLARQDIMLASNDPTATATPPADEESYIIAEEVKSLSFSYFDGANWTDTWDGTTAGPDGVTPIGPPVAIGITLGISFPSHDARAEGEPEIKTYRHVVVIPSANGTVIQTTGQ
jgi:hypothetical protein